MSVDPNEIVAVEMRWDVGGWMSTAYSRDITREQLGDLLKQIGDMAATAGGEQWPVPETAYAEAPGVVYEIGWVAHYAANRPLGTEAVREFWLRKAALLDRIALGDPDDRAAVQLAIEAAGRLRDFDDSGVICDPRHYVRQQYARWAKDQ